MSESTGFRPYIRCNFCFSYGIDFYWYIRSHYYYYYSGQFPSVAVHSWPLCTNW